MKLERLLPRLVCLTTSQVNFQWQGYDWESLEERFNEIVEINEIRKNKKRNKYIIL